MTEGRKAPIVKRLLSGEDLRQTAQKIITEHNLAAGVILSMVGSFQSAQIRLAGAESNLKMDGPLEIVSATGTLGRSGMHIHLSVADKQGTVFGGHLLEGCITASTIELVIADLSDWWTFDRADDAATGYKELNAKPAN